MGMQDNERSDGVATERTALLPGTLPDGHTGEGLGGFGETLDAAESELLLARTASASSAAVLGPEPVDSSLRHGPQYAPSDGADVEAPGPPPLRQRAYLLDTNPRQFRAVFASVLMTFFVANFDGTIMASSVSSIRSSFFPFSARILPLYSRYHFFLSFRHKVVLRKNALRTASGGC